MGKCVLLRPPRVGCTFRKAPQRETTSHSKGKFRDAFFESLPIRKARPTLDASGHGTIDLSGLPSIKRRPPGRRGTKFIASSARKEGHLMWPSSCAGLFEILRKHPPCRGSRVLATTRPFGSGGAEWNRVNGRAVGASIFVRGDKGTVPLSHCNKCDESVAK